MDIFWKLTNGRIDPASTAIQITHHNAPDIISPQGRAVVLSLPILPAGYASLHIFRTRIQGQIGFPYRTVECPRGSTTSAGRSCITARLVPPPHPGERSYVRAGRSNSCALFVYPLMTNEPCGSIACAVMSCGQAESTVSRFKKWNHLQAPLLPSGCSLGGYGCDQANGGSPMPIANAYM